MFDPATLSSPKANQGPSNVTKNSTTVGHTRRKDSAISRLLLLGLTLHLCFSIYVSMSLLPVDSKKMIIATATQLVSPPLAEKTPSQNKMRDLFVPGGINTLEQAVTGDAPIIHPTNSLLREQQEAPIMEAWKVFSCEELKVAQESPSTINFLATAVGQDRYEAVLPLYVFCALSSHREVKSGAVAEIIVPDAKAFVNRTGDALSYLQSTFSTQNHSALCVREFTGQPSNRTRITNTWRYLEVPARFSAKYTYIGDVDLFLTSSVLTQGRFAQMNEWNIPYSNIIRDYSKPPLRLTGLMLVETARFYTEKLQQAQAKLDAMGNDEAFLYQIVKEAGLGLPPQNSTAMVPDTDLSFARYRDTDLSLVRFRPTHGVHLSFNRGPWRAMCLGQRLEVKKMLKDKGLEEFRKHYWFLNGYLDMMRAKVEEEEREDMITFNRTCQPRRDTINK